jgi:hypothetical protein
VIPGIQRSQINLKLARSTAKHAAPMSALPRRLLGNTGLEVSVLGFGASPLGSVFEVCCGVLLLWLGSTEAQKARPVEDRCSCVLLLQEINEAEGIQSVHEAFRLGINFFDTSPFYGTTKSETVSACFCCSAEQNKAACNLAMGLLRIYSRVHLSEVCLSAVFVIAPACCVLNTGCCGTCCAGAGQRSERPATRQDCCGYKSECSWSNKTSPGQLPDV